MSENRFQEIWNEADTAGRKAGLEVETTPFRVVQHSNPLDDNSPVVRAFGIIPGPCGFAWVIIKPAYSRFAKWLIASGKASVDSYYGGVHIWVSEFGQLMERKEAYARAFSEIIEKYKDELKLKSIWYGSRMD